jgi:hypothetical protein
LLFTCNGHPRTDELLEPDKAIAVIGCRKSLVQLPIMLEDSLAQVTCHSDIQGQTPAGYNVSEIATLVHRITQILTSEKTMVWSATEEQMQVLRLRMSQRARQTSLRMTASGGRKDEPPRRASTSRR